MSKTAPEYKGVDPRAQKVVDEYSYLSTQNNITISNKVTIGFKKIGHGDVIGICNYGLFFREIDLDIDFWNNSSNMSRMMLLFHELTHCYCGRDHDYAEGKEYPETRTARITQAFEWRLSGGERPGYWDDGCAVSLMYPEVIDDKCAWAHYNEYVSEMFSRCKPW